jgi:polyphosphate kinase 2 (PPK2 family)
MQAYRVVLERTSTKAAPWHIVPADHKWVRDAVVTEVLTQALEALELEWPALAPELRNLVVE